MEIEVFRTGTFADSTGEQRTYTNDDLRKIADNYNSRLAQDPSVMAPIVKGHPVDNAPALGWTAYLKNLGDKLIAGIRNINPEFMEELQEGRYKKISISLYPDLLLRHIGFLGAASPAVSGLEPADFIEEFPKIINASVSNIPTANNQQDTINYAAEYKQMQEQIATYQRDLAEYQKAERLAQYRQYCQEITKSSGNATLNNIINANLPEIMNLAYNYDSQNSFDSQNSSDKDNNNDNYNLNLVKNFAEKIAKLPILTNYSGEITPIQAPQSFREQGFSRVDSKRLIQHQKAMEIINAKPEISYEQALEII